MRGVHAAPPAVHPWHAVRNQGGCRSGGRGERAVGAAVHSPGPAPRGACGETQPVGGGEPGNVGLVHGHCGHPEPAGGPQPARPDNHGGGQVDEVGAKVAQRGHDLAGGNTDRH